jgi:RHS repeat-associated protein
VAIQAEPALYFVHTDHLNTPRLVADAAGTTVWRWDQIEPFGANSANDDPDGNSVAFDLHLRLPGQRYDVETALHYNYYRDYDPSLGIYKQSDLIGLRGNLNTYAYVFEPVRMTDPLGLMGYGRHGSSAGAGRPPQTNVFGCIVGCLRSPTDGSSETQASLEPTVGGGFEVCERPEEPKSCPVPKPVEGCGIYDPNCDNTWQYPGLPMPRRYGGFIIGASIKRDGRLCFQFGLFGSLPLIPSLDLGDVYEK